MSETDFDDVGTAAQDLFRDALWYEVRILCSPGSFYAWMNTGLPEGSVLMYHHFYEPWHPDGPVVRLLVAGGMVLEVEGRLRYQEVVAGVERWGREQADRDLYSVDDGEAADEWFALAMSFFEASSAFVGHPKAKYMDIKLLHCFLNARGMSRKKEVRWALRYAWTTLTVEPRLWLRSLRTGKKWWE